MKPAAIAQLAVSFVVGLVFALGLGLSGMTQADKVIGFLNVAGAWDPSLAFVMMGAIAVHLVFYRFTVKRPSPLLGGRFGIPTRTDIDPRLVGGSAIFGVGWALGGYCPGPGLVSAASGGASALVFVAAMTGGMLLYHVLQTGWEGRASQPGSPS
ncbi:YeeE/YedE family protein [Myxococcota bacterium]|nr:YeeE/YedE family protein [Myxococcota bacterium]